MLTQRKHSSTAHSATSPLIRARLANCPAPSNSSCAAMRRADLQSLQQQIPNHSAVFMTFAKYSTTLYNVLNYTFQALIAFIVPISFKRSTLNVLVSIIWYLNGTLNGMRTVQSTIGHRECNDHSLITIFLIATYFYLTRAVA